MIEMYYDNRLVKGLVIRYHFLRFLPSGIEEIFGNLEGIHIQGCDLRRIAQRDLQPFSKLKELRIIGNHQLETLEIETFTYNPLLVCIDMSDNNMLAIDCMIFESLIQLKVFYFNYIDPRSDEQERSVAVMKVNLINTCSKLEKAFRSWKCWMLIFIGIAIVYAFSVWIFIIWP